ncbi:GGDEF domain-containing protein [Vibrio sp. T187]|uniref:sensor domain-containing diguanylate cyclase n=1 Tax=Vibrio TaxID=662 RepID=UPI0010C9E1D7|nr:MULTISPECIES: sensor domain-containing diguanylate cyclase [Vibrio]MBW3695978.1 GGDEF domain-containing protein [Vibrio sp. T187]
MFDEQTCLLSAKPDSIDLAKWQQTVDIISELYNSACGTIVQFRQNEFNVVVASLNEDNFLKSGDSWPWEMHSFCRKIAESQEKLYVHNAKDDDLWKDAPAVQDGPVRSYCGLPIYWPNGKIFGTICVIDTKATHYNQTLQSVLYQLCQLITADLQMLSDYETIKSLAICDELTGVNNRRGLRVLGEQKFKDARRYQHAIGVVYLDIDNMKVVNDTFGHPAGDLCIVTLANILKENCRESDIIARMGGDEFIVVSLLGSRRELTLMAGRIEDKYHAATKGHVQLELTSVSYGTSIIDCYSPLSFDELMQEADKKMYQHKQTKRAKAE